MPRAYNEQERESIRIRLLNAAEDRFARFGLRKTTIDELVREARIGKGSFYQFFGSKEELFLAVQERIEEETRGELATDLARLRDDPPAMVRHFFEGILERLERHPFLKLLSDPETLDALVLCIAAGRLREHRRKDREFYRTLFREWIRNDQIRGIDEETLFGIVVTLFVLHQQRSVLGASFPTVVSWLIDSVCARAVAKKKARRS